MNCESCQENLATVHLTEIIQKAKKETHLCETCARERGVTYSTAFSVKDFLGGLAKKAEPAEKPVVKQARRKEPDPEPCGTCGITFAEFRQSGRLGCHRDYDHFDARLLPLLRKIHNDSVQHTGRVPSQIGARLERDAKVAELRAELEQAVGREDYECAAGLRDRIRAVEGEVTSE
jgi:protein arginine kinase activator